MNGCNISSPTSHCKLLNWIMFPCWLYGYMLSQPNYNAVYHLLLARNDGSGIACLSLWAVELFLYCWCCRNGSTSSVLGQIVESAGYENAGELQPRAGKCFMDAADGCEVYIHTYAWECVCVCKWISLLYLNTPAKYHAGPFWKCSHHNAAATSTSQSQLKYSTATIFCRKCNAHHQIRELAKFSNQFGSISCVVLFYYYFLSCTPVRSECRNVFLIRQLNERKLFILQQIFEHLHGVFHFLLFTRPHKANVLEFSFGKIGSPVTGLSAGVRDGFVLFIVHK